MKVLGIIPARGGSKGIKDKNILDVDGQPLISYAIEVAKAATKLTSCVVSTDSIKIAEVAKKWGADVMMRSEELAQDNTPMLPVLQDIIERFKANGEEIDLILLLQVTSPIRTADNINEIIEMFEEDPDIPAVISVVPMDDVHPARMYNLDLNNSMLPLNNRWETSRRQDIPPVYYRNGCFYAIRPEVLLAENTLMPPNKKAYVMPIEWLANVDDKRDLILTEALLKAWKANII